MFLEEDEIGVGESELVVWGVVIEIVGRYPVQNPPGAQLG